MYKVKPFSTRAMLVWLMAAILLAGCDFQQREVTIHIGTESRLTFSVEWGWGIEQSIKLATKTPSVRSVEISRKIWKKPYNAGGPLFATEDRRKYYLVLFDRVYVIYIQNLLIENICDLDENLKLDFIGTFGVSTSSVRGDGVVFVPAGDDPPTWSRAKPDRGAMKNKCG